ncbi:hypothetical protein LXA43DRAFT_1102667 [Ganoderma leucocontextum]|nr:hypothetical protein LXA43DRAFT_1102667 [Ganoderma leucocontextum]
MQPPRPPQPALPFWMRAADPEPAAAPPSDPPQLYPFLSFELPPRRPGDDSTRTLPPQVYVGSGEYPARHDPDDEPNLAYEIRLVGTGGLDDQPTDTTLDFPSSAAAVLHGLHRWRQWVDVFETDVSIITPTLLPEQRRSLLDIARFLRAMATPGDEGLPIAEWPFFWAVFVEDFPPRDKLRRGEVHLERVVRWLRDRYPHVYPLE